MDAWLKQTSRSSGAAKKPTSLKYSKFDKIVDSDDEEEEKQRRRSAARRAAQPRGPEDIPPHLRSAYARVTLAQERGEPVLLRPCKSSRTVSHRLAAVLRTGWSSRGPTTRVHSARRPLGVLLEFSLCKSWLLVAVQYCTHYVRYAIKMYQDGHGENSASSAAAAYGMTP